MLFNSYVFLFFFLPVVLFGFFLLRLTKKQVLVQGWLLFSSLYFYSWWNSDYLLLIIVSMFTNFVLGLCVSSESKGNKHDWSKYILVFGIIFNISLLGYFKYADFFLDNMRWALGNVTISVVLPLAISFYTFQQIAYLVDCRKYKHFEKNVITYGLFVSFFPQLIAGPIVHHKQMIPQFVNMLKPVNWYYVATGLLFIIVGLFKKVLLADSLGYYLVDPIFSSTEAINFYSSWLAAFGYAFQIYFDFSGYCDIATGLALFFGIVLPMNFYSPYKAASIIDFWRRWHITLSSFLKDYLYIPLGGNKKGVSRRYVNLMITMLLGGLWHGAAWGFVIWGILHGVFLMINHYWRNINSKFDLIKIPYPISCFLTFLMVVFAWIVFRANSMSLAFTFYEEMMGFSNIPLLDNNIAIKLIALFSVGLGCFLLPNLWDFTKLNVYRNVDIGQNEGLFSWRISLIGIIGLLFVLFFSLIAMSRQSEFIYFQF